MTNQSNSFNSQHIPAVIAGISLIIMGIAAAFSYGYVHNSLVVSRDSVTTLQNIEASLSLFQCGILGWVVIVLSDILVSWAFYVYLKSIHRDLSLLAGWLRLVYTFILAIAVSHLVIASNLVRQHTSGEFIEFTPSDFMTSILAFESIWSLGLIIFGAHLILVGSIALKSKHIPKVISVLLVIAGASYTLIHLLHGFFPQLDKVTSSIEMVLTIPMTIGELAFGIWLLLKGKK
ncbi:DUF4386 domain-containing protein [Gracilibacillus caseinilyticus]|uniref:DUF4386 domain-containing protein n=1 Tax=Gracilibacillus caseinilyticus TaxID=2932256 RepID=A0ABY4ESI3_9BACI|nr:DUF4386 domain-containing protein [Gracilibacillus caseinilyticus]UOQ46697.1 DUF4386 domain-containing protein [Gracilibacillus caseinilyticus]